MFGSLGATEIILLFFIVLPILFWGIALVDILKNDFKGNNKIIWVLVVIFLPILGSILYLLLGRSQKVVREM